MNFNKVYAVPKFSKNAVKEYAYIYGGTAKPKIKAHLKKFENGKE